jgi:hypothetical protein
VFLGAEVSPGYMLQWSYIRLVLGCTGSHSCLRNLFERSWTKVRCDLQQTDILYLHAISSDLKTLALTLIWLFTWTRARQYGTTYYLCPVGHWKGYYFRDQHVTQHATMNGANQFLEHYLVVWQFVSSWYEFIHVSAPILAVYLTSEGAVLESLTGSSPCTYCTILANSIQYWQSDLNNARHSLQNTLFELFQKEWLVFDVSSLSIQVFVYPRGSTLSDSDVCYWQYFSSLLHFLRTWIFPSLPERFIRLLFCGAINAMVLNVPFYHNIGSRGSVGHTEKHSHVFLTSMYSTNTSWQYQTKSNTKVKCYLAMIAKRVRFL